MDSIIELLRLQISSLDLVLRLVLAAACGALIGWDRENANKPAGVRTFMLITLGSAGFMVFAFEITALHSSETVMIDPTRTLQGIAGGIGFLGAGSIIRSGGSIQGITTAATTWVAGAIGSVCGAGLYGLALLLTAMCFLTLSLLGKMKYRHGERESHLAEDLTQQTD